MDRIEVQTVFGKLSAEVSGDPQYPGIVICIEQNDEDGKYDKQLALAECTPDMPVDGGHSLRLLVWNNDDMDDYTDDFTFIEEASDEEDMLNPQEFYNHIIENYNLDGASSRLVRNIIEYVNLQGFVDQEDTHDHLFQLLDGAFGLEEKEVKQAHFGE